MRNHEEFVNEIYNRKETYLKEKKKTQKNILTFSIPFVLVAVLILVFGLLTSVPFGDMQQLLPKIVLPALFVIDYPLGVGIFTIIAKSDLFAVKK